MNWNQLSHPDQLSLLIEESAKQNVLIFKHSTRCSISRTTLDRLERNWKDSEVPGLKPYFLDLITHRQVSNAIAEKFHVEHESPQVLIIRHGKSIYNTSHFSIDFDEIKETVRS